MRERWELVNDLKRVRLGVSYWRRAYEELVR